MDTLSFILNKYDISLEDLNRNPYPIPNIIRDDLALLFNELNFTVGAEIGVESGAYSDVLLSSNIGLTLYSIDAWKSYRGYRDHTSQVKLDGFYANTQARLAKYGERSIIWKKSSADALHDIPDGSLDFVYIDANHAFFNVAFDIHHWLPKLRVGGIISGHDYKKHKEGINIHVKQVVNAYIDSYFIKPVFIVGSDAKPEGSRRDDSRSFFWVKVK